MTRMLMAGAILLVGTARRAHATDRRASAETKAVNRQREYGDQRDVRPSFHFSLD